MCLVENVPNAVGSRMQETVTINIYRKENLTSKLGSEGH